MKNFSLFILASVFFVACNQDSSPSTELYSTSTDTANPLFNTASTPLDTTPALPPLQPTLNSQAAFAPASNGQNASLPVANKPGVALNPAHGQPGHRCELAVGAPLNGTAAKPNSPEINVKPAASSPAGPSPAITPSPVLPAGKSAGAKLNPAHGQPGHDCKIAVGAPLDGSAAAKPISQNSEIKPTIPSPGITPSPILPVSNTAGVKLNPAHGQPGHDCKIAVGQPLKDQ
ncbi:MAG: hypothetical protein M3413_01240 [Bacteroidota bacterium]|nr:hypothetical protein [Bacteroidota bacterium]